MNIILACVLLPIGLLILLKAADMLVEGSVGLAQRFGISQLIIGLTIVAMGTSAPEVAASITATLTDSGNLAIGNVYGSNIANLALVGGLCAVIRPILVSPGVLRREMPVMLFTALLLFPLLHDGNLSRPDSLILLLLFTGLMIIILRSGLLQARAHRNGTLPVSDLILNVPQTAPTSIVKSTVFILLGLLGLAFGAYLTVESAKALGKAVGISDAVLGITVVAVGTSLPELITCLVAAFKGHDDISVGNLVGSNIFNTLLVVGASGMTRPFSINPRFVGIDYRIMMIISATFFVLALPKKKISRPAGLFMATTYVLYIAYLFVFTRNQ
ncbi:MAG: calcium/sodium antiporter [Sedimentisphaerales bacterium]|nr:calcium/sodium antiporter [Sedimentisphaerales bacterium]